MNLIFIYGPPAAGKLTVSKELAAKTGYKLYDNHAILTPIGKLFSYTDPELNKARSLLGERIRLDVFKTAAQSGIDFISTSARAGTKDFMFFRQIRDTVIEQGGKVLFVQLLAPREVLSERVQEPSRKGIKADSVETLDNILDANPELYDKFPDEEHLTIHNAQMSPSEVAEEIIHFYHLTER